MRVSAACRQPVDQLAGVAVMQADIAELVVVDRGQRLGDGVDEAVAADEAGARIGLRLRDQMLGAAEADFEPHVIGAAEQRAQIGRRRLGRDRARASAAACRTARPAAARSGWPLRRPKKARCDAWRIRLHAPTHHETRNRAAIASQDGLDARPFSVGSRATECRAYFTALLIAAARSVFSQEKPPSLSGARPKWP